MRIPTNQIYKKSKRLAPFALAGLLLSLLCLMAAPARAKPTGYQEYYVLGYEEHIWRAFNAIYDGSISSDICSTVSLVATADHQVIYYDHWEDGYEADLLKPRQSSTLIFGEGADILMAGDEINLASNQNVTATNTITGYVPVNPRDPAYMRYDGGDRIISSGGPINLVHAMWPCDDSWVGGAWEVYSRQAYANAYAYTIPIGEDLYQLDSAAYADFKYVYLQVSAFEDNTTISIDNRAGDVVNLTLDRGQAYSSMGHLNSTSVPSITINAGAVVRTNKPVQVGLVTGGDSPSSGSYTGFQGRFLIVLPTQLWGADYVAPAPGGGVNNEAQIYLSNPNNFPISIDAYHQGAQHAFTIDSTATPISATVPYTHTIGANIPPGSATRFTSPDGVFGVVVCADSGQLAYDWGFAGVPAKYLTQDYYVSWAPGDENVPPQNNGSPLWVTPLADGTTFYVDFSPLDGVVNQTFTLDALEQRRIFDPDNDNTGMHVWATGEFAIVWGVDPLTAGPSSPYLDMGVSILPLIQRWLDPVMVLDKSAQPASLPPTGGVVTFTLTAQTYDAPLDDVGFTDTLPLRWAYVPSSALVTYPDRSTQDTEPAIDERKLYWNLGHDLKEKERLTLTFQAKLTTTGSVGVPITDGFESGDYAGGQNWASDWQASATGVQILGDNPFMGDYHLNIQGTNSYSITGMADLSGFTAPILNFMQQISTTNSPFYLDVHDGETWTTVLTLSEASDSYLQESVDLSAYAGPSTTIRFRSSNSLPSAHLNVDQVEIRDAVAVNVNHGEAIGRHQYADVLFNPYDSATVYISDLRLEKSVNKSEAQIGDTLVYTLTYANLSEAISLTNVTLSDAIPLQYVKFESASHDGVYAGDSGAITWTISDELAPGASVSRTFSVIVNNFVEDGAMIDNTAYANSKQTNQVSSNQVRTSVSAPKVLFTKSAPTAIDSGQVMTYTLFYENVSSVPATEVVIQDQIPISTTYVPGSLAILTDTKWVNLTDATGDDIGAHLSPTLVITPGVIPAHSEGRIRFAVQVEEELAPGSIIRNWATLDRALDIPRESNLSITRITELLIDKQAETASSDRLPHLAVAPGELITYTLIYANVSTTNEQTNVLVREAIPDYTDFVTASTPVSYSWDHGATWLPTQPVTPVTHVRWRDPSLPADAQKSVSLTVRLTDTIPTQTRIENIAYISSTQTGAYLPEWIPSNQVEVGTVDLWIQKAVDQSSVQAGDPVTYTISYGNRGRVAAYDLQIRDVPPTHTQYVSRTIWGPGADDGAPPTLTWQIETLAPGDSGEAGYVALVDGDVPSGTTIANTAALSHPYGVEIVSAPALITITTSADLAVAKSAPATAVAGQSLAYTLTLTNLGPSTARDVALTDTLPTGVDFGAVLSSDLPTFNVEGRTITWFTPTLAPGASASVVFTVAVHPDVTGALTNHAAVASAAADPQPDNDADEASTQIIPRADLALDKRAPATAVAGQSLTYTLTLTHLGPSTARDVALTDTLPPSVDFGAVLSSDLPAPAVEGRTITWFTPTLAPGASAAVVFTVAVHPDVTGALTNHAAVAAAAADPQPDNDADEASTQIGALADVAVAKSAPATAVAGQSLTYSLTLTNNLGPSTARDVTLTDTLPTGVAFGAVLSSDLPAPAVEGRTITWRTPTLAPGASASVVFTVAVGADVDGALTNHAAVAAHTADPQPDNDADEASTQIIPRADLALDKRAPATAVAGQSLAYTLTLTNNLGPSTARDVALTDTLPTSVDFGAVLSSDLPAPAVEGRTITWFTPTLAPGASATVVFTVAVGAEAEGTLTNTAAVASAAADPQPDNDADEASTQIAALADLAVAKSAPATAIAGQSLAYTLTLTNNLGPSTARDVTLTDTLPTGVDFGAVLSSDLPTFNVEGRTITWFTPTLAPGASASVVFTVAVGAEAEGTLTNTAAVAAHTADPQPENDADEASTQIIPRADLAVAKSAPATAVAGQSLTYTLTLTNNLGPSTARDVALTDTLPTGVDFGAVLSSDLPAPAVEGRTITWFTPTLAPGASATVVFTVAVGAEAEGTLTNHAAVASAAADPQPENDADEASTQIAARADLAVAKSAPATAVAGQSLAYTLTLTNLGPSTARDVALTDTLPTGVDFGAVLSSDLPTFNVEGRTITWFTPTLAPGASASVVFTVAVGAEAEGTLTNTAAVASAAADPQPDNDADEASTQIAALADLAVAKSAPATAVAGQSLAYTLTLTNLGPSTARDVALTDTLPPSVDFGAVLSSDLPAPTVEGRTVTWRTPTLAPGASASVVFTVAVHPDVTDALTNHAAVTSAAADPQPDNDADEASTQIIPRADLALDKRAPATAVAGQSLAYTLTLTNLGPSTARDVALTDTLPTGVDFGAVLSSDLPAPAVEGRTITWFTPTLAPGASASVVFTVAVGADGDGALTNHAAVAAHTADPQPDNDADEASTQIIPRADLALDKRAPATAVAGQSLAYTLTLTNLGPSTARDVALTDTLPTGVDFGAVLSSDLPAPAVEGRTITWFTPTLAPGASASVVFTVAVGADVEGALTNHAAVTSAAADPQPDNDADEASTQIIPRADLAIAKSAPATAVAGQSLAYTLTLTHLGPSTARDVALTDTLPTGVDFGAVLSSDLPAPTVEGRTITWFTPTLASGASASVVFTVAVHPDVIGALTNHAAVASDTADPQPDNDADEASTSIVPPGPAVIQGAVFLDANGNGRQDSEEEGLYKVLITMDDTVTTTTDANGRYVFTTTEAGYHTVVETDPTRYIPPGQGPLAVLDVGYFSTTPNRVIVNVERGHTYQVDFGDASNRAPFAVVHGTVFQDDNGDGLQGNAEAGLSNVLVSLNHAMTTTTDLYGRYTITTSTSGIQVVTETDPPDYFSSTPNQVQIQVYRGRGYTVNFGDVPSDAGFASIYGIVYDDANGNATLDADETGIPGATITMNDTQTATTGPYGAYTFSTWAPNTHTLVETDPPGYVSTTPNTRQIAVELNEGYRVDFGDKLSGDCPPDFYEPDDSPAQASTFVVGAVQSHNFCDDAHDWVKFQTEAHMVYTLTTTIWEARADTILSLFDTDGETLLASNDDYTTTGASRIVWSAPSTNVYYALVANKDAVTGTQTIYSLRITGGEPYQLYMPLVMRNN